MQQGALLPAVQTFSEQSGLWALNADTSIIASSVFHAAASLFSARLRTATGYLLPVSETSGTSKGPRIEFAQDDHITHPEGYILHVGENDVLIRASTPTGAYYGAQTLLQLLPPCVYGEELRHDIEWKVPCVEIQDAPRFQWRGVMLDSARYFQPVPYLKKFIDLLGQHKLNVFHWHLTDDQGWRIEIKKYPRLTEIGARRRESPRGHLSNPASVGDGCAHEGFYTQEEIRELVAYAAERQVRIVPEIEMPGHAQAAVAAYPELGIGSEPVSVSCRWGVHPTLFNTKDSTFQFLQDVLDEVMALFPGEYIHIGGDEAIKDQWKNDPATQAHRQELGLADDHELQRWFIGRIGEFLHARGRKLVGWDEILEGGLAKGATVMSWRGTDGAVQAAKRGLDSVMCDRDFLYLDYYQGDPAAEPQAIGGLLPLEKVHGYNPMPAGLPGDLAQHLLGVQAQLWTEYIATPSRLEYMAFPRLCALAEIAWCGQDRPDYADFLQRLQIHLQRLDCQDVRYRPTSK